MENTESAIKNEQPIEACNIEYTRRKKKYKALHFSTVKLPPSNSIIVYIPSSSIEEDQLYVMGVL